MAISDDGMWLFAPLVQTRSEPPSKLLIVKIGPTDYHDPIAPESQMTPLPFIWLGTSWQVSWSGSDDSSGIDYYEVEYRVGQNGLWTSWLKTRENKTVFSDAIPGQRYYFRVAAHDYAGNVELYPETFDTSALAGSGTQIFLPAANH